MNDLLRIQEPLSLKDVEEAARKIGREAACRVQFATMQGLVVFSSQLEPFDPIPVFRERVAINPRCTCSTCGESIPPGKAGRMCVTCRGVK